MDPLSFDDDPAEFRPTAGQTYFCLIRADTINGYIVKILPGDQIFTTMKPMLELHTDIVFFMIEFGKMTKMHKKMFQNIIGNPAIDNIRPPETFRVFIESITDATKSTIDIMSFGNQDHLQRF